MINSAFVFLSLVACGAASVVTHTLLVDFKKYNILHNHFGICKMEKIIRRKGEAKIMSRISNLQDFRPIVRVRLFDENEK